jgi:hypothetical protein
MDEFLFKLQHLLRSVKSAFIVSLFFSTSLLTACFEKRTTNPLKAYRYWSDEDPGKDVRLLHAVIGKAPIGVKSMNFILNFPLHLHGDRPSPPNIIFTSIPFSAYRRISLRGSCLVNTTKSGSRPATSRHHFCWKIPLPDGYDCMTCNYKPPLSS